MDLKHLLGLAFLLQVTGDVFAVNEDFTTFVKPCNVDDLICLNQSTEMFLEHTHKGIPLYNIEAIDPLVIPSLDILFDKEGLTYKYTNLTIKGLKNQRLSDFKMNTTDKSVVLTTKADLHMSSGIIINFTKSSNSLEGHYTSQGSVLGTANYGYELIPGGDGVDHFDIGPDTISCKAVGTPKVELNPELAQALANGPDAKAFSEQKTELFEKLFYKAVEEAYKHVVHNIRAAARIIPATLFFTDTRDM